MNLWIFLGTVVVELLLITPVARGIFDHYFGEKTEHERDLEAIKAETKRVSDAKKPPMAGVRY